MKAEPHVCPLCRGSQRVEETLYNQGSSAAGRVPCRSCDGQGIVWGLIPEDGDEDDRDGGWMPPPVTPGPDGLTVNTGLDRWIFWPQMPTDALDS